MINKAVKITENVYWVGAIDWALRDFHGYATERGTTYNAYLVLGKKIALIDTVKVQFKDELLERISSVVDPQKIDYIISNHSEMDHTGCLMELIDIAKPEKVYASAKGIEALTEHFPGSSELFSKADENEPLDIGGLTLQFIETRMLHWPDSMVTYIPETEILFTQDAFGSHLATSERFEEDVPQWIVDYESAKYYANILMPFSNLIPKLAEKLSKLNIKILANDHGPIWRKNINRILELYTKWAAQNPSNKAVIVYDTMWGSTDKMARAISEGLYQNGVSVKLMPLSGNHRSDIATEILEAGTLFIGTPTLNKNIFPAVADILYYLKGLAPKNLIGDAFGSYGWADTATSQVRDFMAGMKIELINDKPIASKYVPDNELLSKCYEMGEKAAQRIKEKLS